MEGMPCRMFSNLRCNDVGRCQSELGGRNNCVLDQERRDFAMKNPLATKSLVSNSGITVAEARDYQNNGHSHHDDPNANLDRITHMTLNLKTFGTDAQRRATIERLKKELALQGFNFSIQVISYT